MKANARLRIAPSMALVPFETGMATFFLAVRAAENNNLRVWQAQLRARGMDADQLIRDADMEEAALDWKLADMELDAALQRATEALRARDLRRWQFLNRLCAQVRPQSNSLVPSMARIGRRTMDAPEGGANGNGERTHT